MESSISTTNQSTNPKLYTDILHARCDKKEAFEFDSESTLKIGHLLNLSFSSNDRKLDQNIRVCNPQNPNNMVDIAGVISYVGWDANDFLSMSFRLSPQNKALLQEVLCTSDESLELAIELVVYEYDYDEKKYFQQFRMKKPVSFEISGLVSINDEPDRCFKKPLGFECSMGLNVSKNVFNQEIYFATSASGKTHKRILNPSTNA